MMEFWGTLVSWLKEAMHDLSASLYEPKFWGALLTIFILVILYSIVSSINRLKKQIAELSSQMAAVRSALKEIEWTLARIEEKSYSTGERKNIFRLSLRDDHDKTEWK